MYKLVSINYAITNTNNYKYYYIISEGTNVPRILGSNFIALHGKSVEWTIQLYACI